ncbi:MAG: GspH/FimT family pseudopilin [Xanthomonadaceae bacterium]|nr:GspH/FimT family pseudopilin [Xanthomonadaceae bacterium]
MFTYGVLRNRAHYSAQGFTLVELMVTLAVAAILAMIAVPSFRHLILVNRLDTAANAIVNGVNIARLDAVKLNATTQFCGNSSTSNGSDTLGAACGTQAGAVYSLPQSSSTAAEVQAAPDDLSSPLQVAKAGVTGVRFSGRGFGYSPTGSSDSPYTGTIAVICTSELASSNQRVVSMTAGAILATASSTGTCP